MKEVVDKMASSFDLVLEATLEKQPLLILTPKRPILLRLGRLWLQLFIAAFFSFNVFWYISIPVYAYTGYLFIQLKDVWQFHRYKVKVLYGLTFIVLINSFVITAAMRKAISKLMYY